MVDKDYIQRYRYVHLLAATPLPYLTTLSAGGPMEVVGLSSARKNLISPGVRGTLSAFGVPLFSPPWRNTSLHVPD